MSEDRKHAFFGGSSAHIWSNCTGSVFLLQEIPEIPAGPDAERGTEVHSICENLLKSFLHYKQTGELQDVTAQYSNDEEGLELAKGYVEAVWEKVLFKTITGKGFGLEEKFIIDEHLKMWGFADFWCVYIDDRGKRAGCIVDYKNGYVRVEADKNVQLAFYALGLLLLVRELGKDLDYVRAVIYQPNDGSEEAYREHTFSIKQLETFHKKFLKAAHSILIKNKATFKTGKWCTFCKAKAVCKKYQENLGAKSSLALINDDNFKLPVLKTVSDKVLVNILTHRKEIEKLLKAAHEYALSRHTSGNPIEGIKIVEGRSQRKWLDDHNKIVTDIEETVGKNKINLWNEPKIKSLTSLEKELKKVVGKETTEGLLTRLTTRTAPTLYIVPESDPRPAIKSVLDYLQPLGDALGDEGE